MLWNLYFRERVNLGQSLALKSKPAVSAPLAVSEEDAAMAAARCYQRLQEGTYVGAEGKRRAIAGDTSKLLFAEGTTQKERQIFGNLHFMSGSLPGTQEVRRRMGRIGFGARIVYGTGIFCTISPSERHNGLVIRLSRYCQR